MSIKNKILTFAIAVAGLTAVATGPVYAVNVITDSCGSGGSAKLCDAQKENIETKGFAANLTNTMLFVLGAISVIAIIIGGITYSTANGDPSKTKRAKDIIMYAVIGLIVAIMAWGIVSFVVNRF